MMIRPATADDIPELYRLLRASAEEQGGLDALCVDEAALREDGFGANPRFAALMAEVDGAVAGMALYFFTYSTWHSRDGIHLEDLYVRPNFRRHGVARTLMRRLAEIAVEHGCERFLWYVLVENTPALRFYESLGASTNPRWTAMSVDPITLLKKLGS